MSDRARLARIAAADAVFVSAMSVQKRSRVSLLAGPARETTVGCRFRCDFSDIIQLNGGLTRSRTLETVRDDLGALLTLGYRGGVFTVDDNFVGNPEAIESILHVMIDFQRTHGYPFSFYTQASLDLGSAKLAHLLPWMKAAGFPEVCLGIENPDPAALARMNKKQNLKVGIGETVRAIQQGILGRARREYFRLLWKASRST